MSTRRTNRRPKQRLNASATALVFVLLTFLVSASRAASSSSFVIVVSPNVSVAELESSFVADAFLKKKTRWSNGDLIRPVDLKSDSPVRASFSERVLGRSVAAVRSYWQQRIFSGRDLPPPEFGSEAATVEFVARTEGAIGYVSPNAKLDGVRVVALR